MLKVYKHTFNLFSENTYILADETGECAVIDPGCNNDKERRELIETIDAHGLKPVKLLNTHCHIDHFPGNKFVCDTYGLLPEFHELEWQVMLGALDYQQFFNFPIEPSPRPQHFLNEGDVVKFGNTELKCLFTPGHSVGHLAFYCEKEKAIFSGDVLFYGSIGRFDLPGADGKTLYRSLMDKMMTLPDDVMVYSGHGPKTTIGRERRENPYMNEDFFFN